MTIALSGASSPDTCDTQPQRLCCGQYFGGDAGRGRHYRSSTPSWLRPRCTAAPSEPDLLDEVAWWQTDDFWEYALFAAIAYVRAAVDRASVPMREACQQLAEYPVYPVP